MMNDAGRRRWTPFGFLSNKKPTIWLGQPKYRVTKIRPKAVRGGIFCSFFNFNICHPEVAGDGVSGVISGVAVDLVGVYVFIKFGDFWLKSGRFILTLLAEHVLCNCI